MRATELRSRGPPPRGTECFPEVSGSGPKDRRLGHLSTSSISRGLRAAAEGDALTHTVEEAVGQRVDIHGVT